MSKLRLFVAVLLLLSCVVCALWAKPKVTAQDKCDIAYTNCYSKCGDNNTGAGLVICRRHCKDDWDACYRKIGLPPPKAIRTPSGPLPTASAAPGTTHLQPQGTLTLASPTPTPKTGLHPQGTLTQASPTPGMISHDKKKKKKH